MRTLESTRVSAINVDVLDLNGVIDVVEGEGGWPEPFHLTTGWAWARVKTEAGIYVLNTEGVGPAHPIINERPWVLALYRYPQGIAYGVARRPRLYPQEVSELPVKERVPLTQFIRKVGPTLERNFQTWNDRLTTAGVAA